MNPFAEKYKTLSNAALLAIVAKPSDYQESAVEAAQNELDQRKLTEAELAEANAKNEAVLHKEQERAEARQATKNKVRAWGINFADTIDPFGIKKLSAELLVKRICIIMALILVYGIFTRLDLLKCLFLDETCYWSVSMVVTMLPVIILPPAIVLFWLRKKAGWILLTSFLIYIVIATVHLIYKDVKIIGSSFVSEHLMQNLILSCIGNAVLYGLILLMICAKRIRGMCTVNGNTWTIVSLLVFAFLGLQQIF